MSPMGFRKTEPELYADIAKLKKQVTDLRARLAALVEAAEVLRSKYCETCERIGCGKTEEHCPQVKAVVDALNRAKGV